MSDNVVTLSHGAGGEVMRRFIRDLMVAEFKNEYLALLPDAALLTVPNSELAFTTDSYVVKPIEFPGGDIGKLAVCGTVNDLAVMGAKPQFLSAAFILEEGLDLSVIERIVKSMAKAAREAGVQIVTGDTKVTARGESDGIFINTSGIGVRPLGKGLCRRTVAAGDAIIVSGTMGDHGAAILCARESLAFKTKIESDCAALNGLIESVLNECDGVEWMRDPTRGGLAATLVELTEEKAYGVLIEEAAVPVRDSVQAVCELLGFDPFHLANEGKVVMVVDAAQADMALRLLRAHPLGHAAAMIGRVTADGAGTVRVKTTVGGVRRLQRPAGELLPRIC
jgi:hydrogenase expression/formation protein HypE